MPWQTSLTDQEKSLPLQLETDQASSLFQDVASRRSSRLLWTGFGFVALMLVGLSARALHPLASHASAAHSRFAADVAFAPVLVVGPRGTRRVMPLGSSQARAPVYRRGRLAGFPSISLPAVKRPVVLKPTFSEAESNSADDASDPLAFALGVEDERRKIQTQEKYQENVAEALDSLLHDIPRILESDEDSEKGRPFNWNIYTESLQTDYTTTDRLALRLLGSKRLSIVQLWFFGRVLFRNPDVAEGETAAVVVAKNLDENMDILKKLRFFVSRFLQKDSPMTATTQLGVDTDTGEDIIESSWTANLVLRRLKIPKWLSKVLGLDDCLTPGGIVIVQSKAKLYLNAEGKIYRHSIDLLKLSIVDPQGNSLVPGY